MATRFPRWIIPAVVAAVVLLVAQWFDASVLADANHRANATFDVGPVFDLTPVAHLLTAAGVVALVGAAWWSRSLLVGLGYAVVGGFLVFLPALFWTFATRVNGSPTLAPQAIARPIGDWYSMVSTGPIGSLFTLGGAMFLAGLAVIWAALRSSGQAAVQAPATAPTA
jgi:hypothetical protein